MKNRRKIKQKAGNRSFKTKCKIEKMKQNRRKIKQKEGNPVHLLYRILQNISCKMRTRSCFTFMRNSSGNFLTFSSRKNDM
jgi:hypothetical protein